MIDYEKLKLAHELAEKLPHEDWDITSRYSLKQTYFVLTFTHNIDGLFYEEEFDSINDLIMRLVELTKPKPKFKVGDVVWYAEDLHIYNFEVESYSQGKNINGWMYTGADDMMSEAYLYASRQELIKSQIDYWQSLKEPDVESNQVQSDVDSCQHESDGKVYLTNPSEYLCKKCGQFYRRFGSRKCGEVYR